MRKSKRNRNVLIGLVIAILAVVGTVAARRNKSPEEPKIDVRTEKAEIGDVQVRVTEVGTVEPEIKVDVKSALSGKVVTIHVREGDRVKRGKLLATVEPDLNQAQALSETKNSLRAAEIQVNEARRSYDSDRQLFAQGLLAGKQHHESQTRYLAAKQEFDSAREKYKIIEHSGIPISRPVSRFSGSSIVAPMDGVILTKTVEVGETVTSGVSSFNAGTVLFTVADVSSMIVKAGVNEVDIGKIHATQPVKVTLDAYPKVKFPGKIERIAPAVRIDDKVRVFDVEVRLDSQGKELRAGMTANIEVEGERKQKVLTVPVEAVFQRDDGEIVYVRKKTSAVAPASKKKSDGDPSFDKEGWKQNFEKRTVVTGLSDNSRVEIISGLKVGDEVALEDPTLPRDKRDEDD